MGKKVDIAEVSDLSDDLSSAVSDIQSQLDSIKSNIDQINSMDSFSGQAATEAKGYFNDLHKTVLESFSNLFTDLESQLKQHLDSFQSQVDNSASAIVESDYLNENKMDIDDAYENINAERQSINQTLNDVADISSVAAPVFSSVSNDKNETVETIFDLEETFSSFTSEGSQHDSQIKDLLNHIEVTINRANTQSGTARFTDYQSSSINVGLSALRGYIVTNQKDDIQNLSDKEKAILAKAGEDYKNGNIDLSTFIAITVALNQGGAEYLKNITDKKKLNGFSKSDVQKVSEWNEDNFAFFLDLEKILKEQQELGPHGENGGYETPEIWEINLQINQYKEAQNHALQYNDEKAFKEAKDKEKQLREKYAELSPYLIQEDEPPHHLPTEQLQLESGETFHYRIDSEGYLHYKAEPDYEYYEENHKQTTGQQVQGVVAKTVFTTLLGRGVGGIKTKTTEKIGTIGGGITGVSSELAGPHKWNVLYVPSADEVKTMIYRTHKGNGEIENLVIDSKGNEIIKYEDWEKYK
ncbi:T7SS effector LXG polymorphic toxin [Virgibacillus kimchii]